MRKAILGGVLILVVVGCATSTDDGASPLKGKLDAALAIKDGILRDDALVKVALDAAAAGELKVVKKAVGEIRDGIKRDDAASASAFKLAERGQTSEATEIGNLIRDGIKRDATLSKIAKS
jgi:hypothetical protein